MNLYIFIFMFMLFIAQLFFAATTAQPESRGEGGRRQGGGR